MVGSLKGFIYIAYCSFRVQVPKLVICIQAILCPEELWYVSERVLLLHPYYSRRYAQFEYKLYESSTKRTDCIRHLGVLIDTKLHFHNR